ncbi:hypothetical protein EDD17DRAFT_624080 [Pisolithus thermaeus]|nr:hypothetical protein EDD17DRAFT_624080 [Pisolithus thermaeus]
MREQQRFDDLLCETSVMSSCALLGSRLTVMHSCSSAKMRELPICVLVLPRVSDPFTDDRICYPCSPARKQTWTIVPDSLEPSLVSAAGIYSRWVLFSCSLYGANGIVKDRVPPSRLTSSDSGVSRSRQLVRQIARSDRALVHPNRTDSLAERWACTRSRETFLLLDLCLGRGRRRGNRLVISPGPCLRRIFFMVLEDCRQNKHFFLRRSLPQPPISLLPDPRHAPMTLQDWKALCTHPTGAEPLLPVPSILLSPLLS